MVLNYCRIKNMNECVTVDQGGNFQELHCQLFNSHPCLIRYKIQTP